MLVYEMRWYDEEKREWVGKAITHEKALDLALGCYKDCDMTKDMIAIPNRIKLMGSCYIDITGDDGRVLMAGLYNLLPMNVRYDDNGNRVEG